MEKQAWVCSPKARGLHYLNLYHSVDKRLSPEAARSSLLIRELWAWFLLQFRLNNRQGFWLPMIYAVFWIFLSGLSKRSINVKGQKNLTRDLAQFLLTTAIF